MTPDNPVSRFFWGVRYPFRGIRLVLTRPGTWPYLVIPSSITALAFLTALYLAWHGVPRLLGQIWAPGHGAWAVDVLWLSLVLVLRAIAFLVLGIGLYFSAGLIAVPFNDRLSELVETLVREPGPQPDGRISAFAATAVSVAHSALSFSLYLLVMVGLMVFELAPGLGSGVHVVLGLIATSLFLAREMMDGAMSRRRMGYLHKVRVLGANLSAVLGFGVVSAVLLWIPFMNFVLLPMMVAGGTLMFCDLERDGGVP